MIDFSTWVVSGAITTVVSVTFPDCVASRYHHTHTSTVPGDKRQALSSSFAEDRILSVLCCSLFAFDKRIFYPSHAHNAPTRFSRSLFSWMIYPSIQTHRNTVFSRSLSAYSNDAIRLYFYFIIHGMQYDNSCFSAIVKNGTDRAISPE